MTVYLLHFEPPVGRAQHYMGVCRDDRLNKRLREHANGRGAALTRRAHARGVKMFLVRSFEGEDHHAERKRKRQSAFYALCPLCSPTLDIERAQVFQLDCTLPPQAVMIEAASFPTRTEPHTKQT